MVWTVMRRLIRYLPIALILATLLGLHSPLLVKAQGVAISGTFYRQNFRLVPGETVSTPDIYVVVFNHDDDDLRISLSSYVSPAAQAEILLSESDFVIPPGGNQKVTVGVRVGDNAIPGDYSISITANVVKESTGISVTGGAQQQAKLSIFGEAGNARINTVTYDVEPFPGEIHLFQLMEEQVMPSGYSHTGDLDIRLVPGDYRVQVLYKGNELAVEEFSLQADETKEITIVARPVSIVGFSAVPNFFQDTGEIAFASINYTIRNLYRPEKNVKAVLNVSLDGALIDEGEIFSLPTLGLEGMTGSYKYVPSQRWQEGYYVFQLQVRSQDTDASIAESRKASLRLIKRKGRLKIGLRDEFDLHPSGGKLVSSDGTITISVPPGALDKPVMVVIETAANVPSPPSGFSLGTTALDIEATSVESGLPVTDLNNPVGMCLAYTNDEMKATDGDVTRLYVGYYDRAKGAWRPLESEAEIGDSRVCASTDHWSTWTVLIKHRGLPAWIIIVSALGGVVCAAILVFLAIRYRLVERAGNIVRRYRVTAWILAKLERLPLHRVSLPGKVQEWLRRPRKRPPTDQQ